jgi:hypothetical protein
MSTSRTREKADGELFKSTGIDDNATSTAVTIDASENVLVGKTSASFGVAGVRVRGDTVGIIEATSANNMLVLNRLTSDGPMASFYKDGTSVGSIGTSGNQSYIHGAGTDVGLFWGSNNVYPYRSTGLNDATIDLGQSSKRFKDAYLSGGVYLGGTGAANKLDDYEEGTFLPFVQATGDNCTGLSFTGGYYTKIGRLVNLSFNVWGTITSASAETNIKFALPFSAINSGNQAAGGSANFYTGSGVNRFSVGAIWNGAGELATSLIYIPASAMNTAGAISGMALAMTYLTP